MVKIPSMSFSQVKRVCTAESLGHLYRNKKALVEVLFLQTLHIGAEAH